MLEVFISRSSDSKRHRIYPEPDRETGCILEEAGSYIIEVVGLDSPDETELLFDGEQLQALRSPSEDTGRWIWQVGFYAGDVELTLVFPNRSHKEIRATVSPDLSKLRREHFDIMLQEILEDSFKLFSLSGFRRSFARAAGTRPPPIARLEYLRSHIGDIERSLVEISKHPVRILRSDTTVVPFNKGGRLKGLDLAKSFQGQHIQRVTDRSIKLPSTMKGYYPAKVRKTRTIEDLNIPEHRQIKGCLLRWSEWLSSAAQALERSSASDETLDKERKRWSRRCRKLAQRLRALLDLNFLRDVAPSYARLSTGYIFSRKPAYRSFMKAATAMNAGVGRVFGDFLDLPLARTFDLYEIWVYLRFVRAALKMNGITTIEGEDIFSEHQLGVNLRGDQIRIDVGSGSVLCFQKTFHEYWRDSTKSGTFTRVMRPDISLFLDNGKTLVALDAKYRVGGSLNDAVSSIHVYRDALVQEQSDKLQALVKGAYLISPFLPDLPDPDNWEKLEMPSRLFHPLYRSKFRFGAIALVPGMSLEQVGQILSDLIVDMSAPTT